AAGRFNLSGMLYGVAGLFAMAAGIVMIKPLFERVPLFWIICIRLAAGVAASAALFFMLRHRRSLIATLARTERKTTLIVACVLSTYVSMIFWVAGYKYN